jgi:hypothetical protein
MTGTEKMTNGEYRLLRQAEGRTGFAHMRVRVTDIVDRGQPGVVWGGDSGDTTSAQPDVDADEVRPLLMGRPMLSRQWPASASNRPTVA